MFSLKVHDIAIVVVIAVASMVGILKCYSINKEKESLQSEVVLLELEVENAKAKVTLAEINRNSAVQAVETQNKAMANLKINLTQKLEELDEWKHKKPQVRYEVIYRDIKDKESEECNDIKNNIKALSSIDYSAL
jgi:hypothetical protein